MKLKTRLNSERYAQLEHFLKDSENQVEHHWHRDRASQAVYRSKLLKMKVGDFDENGNPHFDIEIEVREDKRFALSKEKLYQLVDLLYHLD